MIDQSARDRRMWLALASLAFGGAMCTVYAGVALYAIGWLAWPVQTAVLRIRWLGWLGAGALSLVGITLTGFATVLGRRAWKLRAGPLDASAEGGELEKAAG